MKMPVATMTRSPHLTELENGLKSLKSSKLRSRHEFETMYGLIEKHHRDLRLGYLTGMPSDRRKQAEQDCKFYYILTKMLGEIDCDGEAEKEMALTQVYSWYEENRKVLHTGPRFGRAKRKASRESRPGSRRDEDRSTRPSTAGSSVISSRVPAPPRSASSLSQVSSAKTRRPNENNCQSTPEQVLPPEAEGGSPRPVSPSEVSAATQYYYQQYGGGHIEDVGLNPQEEEQDLPPTEPVPPDTRRPYSAPTPQNDHRPQSSFSGDSTQAPTPDVAMRGRRPATAASESVLLPRRKPLPLPHVFNPLSKAFEATVELPTSGPPTDRTTGSGRFQLSSRAGTPRDSPNNPTKEDSKQGDGGRIYDDAGGGSVYQDQAGGVISLRMTHLQKWGTFQQNQSMGQDMLAKLQHVGRAGVPGSTRYAAHEHGLTTEDMTQHVIANYALVDDYQKSQQGPTPAADKRSLIDKPLEEFYESTEPYYPVKRNKYPSFRGKSAPPGGKPQRQVGDKENQATGPGSGSSEGGNGRESSLKLDTLVNMIDTVTDEMTCHKEKVAPDPLPGFRQPTVYVEQGSRPQTAPPGARARPTTPDNRDTRSESHMYSQLAPGREQLLRPATEGATAGRGQGDSVCSRQSPQPPALELIDWRGKVTPDSARSKWSQSFGGHSFVQKMARPRSSLRSAGTGGGTSRRPKTSSTSATSNTKTTTIEEIWNPEMLAADNRRPPVAASHTTTEVDSDVVSSLLTTTKFNSAKMRTRPGIPDEDDDLDFLMYMDSRRIGGDHQASATPAPNKAYLSFCSSMKGPQDMRTSVDEKPVQLIQRTTKSETAHSANAEVPVNPPLTNGAPLMTDTSKFLEEVQRLVANGALEEQDDDEVHPNTARSDHGHPPATTEENGDVQLEENKEEGPGRRRQLTFLVDDTKVVPGEEEEEDAQMTTAGDFGLSADEAAIMNVDVDQYLKTYSQTSKGAPGGGTAASRLSAGYKHRVFQLSFPRQQQPPTSATPTDDVPDVSAKDDVEGLTIEGQGARTQDKRKALVAVGSSAAKGKGKKGASAASSSRVAGTVPARAKSANPLRVLQKQSEMLKKSPVEPYRTPPSIPTPWSQFGTRTQRPPTPSTVYMAELEAQSRKMNSPKDYVEKVTDLRRPPTDGEENVPRLPPPAEMTEQERQLVEPLKVFRMKHEDGTPIIISCEPRAGRGGPAAAHSHGHGSGPGGDQPCAACVQEGGPPGPAGEYMGQRLLDMGRPIPQYLPACDPVEVAAAAQRLKEAQAAVDIQRIFRGYVARNQYKFLLKEEREQREDHQKAAIEIQRRMRGHLSRKRAIYRREANPETLVWAKEYREQLRDRERHRKVKAFVDQERIGKKNAETAAKLSIIGPHVDVYEPFHPKKTGPDRALFNRAAIIIQKVARGWLIRLQMDRLKRKAKYHSSSWNKFMTTYRELLRRIQLRAGMDKPRAPFDFRDINEYMDLKKRYESVFDKRAFGGEMEHEELPAYFKECDLYPAKSEVDDAISSVFRDDLAYSEDGQVLKKNRGLFKQEVMEITFQLYPLKGTGLSSNRRSTWLNPIVDGEEAVKLSGTDNVEATDFKTCWKLVSGVAKDRRDEDARAKREAEEEEERQEDLRREALKAKSKQEKKLALPAGADPETKTSKTEGTPPEVTPSAEPEIAEPEKKADVVVVEEHQKDPPAATVAEQITGPQTQEEKSFIEQKLEKIENEAPDWEPAKSEQQQQQQVDTVLSSNLDTITEATETELKSNLKGQTELGEEP